MKVCKFGGSSCADASQIRRVCDIVLADEERRIVVVSAPGKRHGDDIKVTDLLIACAEARLAGADVTAPLAAVMARFDSIHADLELPPALLEQVQADLTAVVQGDASHAGHYMDAVKAAGEDNCAKLVAGELQRRGAAAHYLSPRDAGMLLSDEFGNARLLPEAHARLAALADEPDRIVFPGFFGYTRTGQVATFSRGGSDITGSILAAAVKAEVYENFTDVDGVYCCDPRIVPNPLAITKISYREMRELAYAGFGVLHDEAILPAVSAGIPINIRNTNRPEAPGTVILPRHADSESRVVGIASSGGFCTIYVSKYLMNREIGFGRKLLQILEEEGVSYEHTPSGIDDMSVIVREENLPPEVEARVLTRLRSELVVDSVAIEHGLALVMIVGEGMRYSLGTAAKATRAFEESGISIEMMNQGSSEISMMFGVKAADREQAIRSLYHAFFE